MPRFTTVPIDVVVPRHKRVHASRQSLQRQEYCEALHGALSSGRALVIDLESGDAPRNIRYRLRAAARALGHQQLIVRRKGSQIFAYQQESPESE